MYSFRKSWILGLMVLGLVGCKGAVDDLKPSGSDRRSIAVESVAAAPSQLTLKTTTGASRTLPDLAVGKRGAVFYFTMWCPICASHTDHLIDHIIPQHPALDYYLIDYVSGDVAGAKNSQDASGYGGAPFEVLVDENQQALNAFQGGMAVVVVLDPTGKVVFNEEYKDGVKLSALLGTL